MTAAISVDLADPGTFMGIKLLGVQGVDVTVDGEAVETMMFGEQRTIELAEGTRNVGLTLHAIARRKSKDLKLHCTNSQRIALKGSYSRLWGSIKLART